MLRKILNFIVYERDKNVFLLISENKIWKKIIISFLVFLH
jgi:hypothetical protein